MDIVSLCGLIFIAVFLTVVGIDHLISSDRRLVESRVKELAQEDGKIETSREKEMAEPSDFWRKILAWAGGLSIAKKPGRLIDKKLEEADVLLHGGEFVVIVVATSLGAGAFFTAISANAKMGFCMGLAAGWIPFVLLNSTRAKRLTSFNSQIGDALSIMSNALRSGFSFLQSMDMVREELPDPIRKEFGRTIKEINFGTPTERALLNLSSRVNSEDLDLMVTAVLIQRQVGGNLAEVLDNIAEALRDRIRIKREVKTLTAQGRISGLIIGLLPLLLALYMLAVKPSYILELFTTPIGWLLISVAVIGEMIGMVIISKIVNIDY